MVHGREEQQARHGGLLGGAVAVGQHDECLPDSIAASTSSQTAAMRFCIAFLPASTR